MTTQVPGYRQSFEAYHGGRGSGDPQWVRSLREAGLARFDELGFPTTKHEEWRFTDVGPIVKTPYTLGMGTAVVGQDDLKAFDIEGLEGPRLVFVNGRFDSSLSNLTGIPEAVTVSSLSEAVRHHGDLVEPHLARLHGADDESFTALNQAFLEDGLFVHVPDRAELPKAVHALFVTQTGSDPIMTHPRNLFVLGADARATIIEDYVTLGEGAVFTNSVTEVVVGARAVGRHYFLDREDPKAHSISTLYVDQEEDTDFATHSALMGSALTRNNVFPTLNGERCMSVLNGMYMPRDTQHHDNRMRVHHAQPNCESRQYYRGILQDRAKAMFTGRIIVDQAAQKTDAVQSNKNLLLSDDALVEAKPQLEIYADDVKCTHGATVGQIDEKAIFYFLARGIDRATAQRLITFAFVNEILERMELEPVRRKLQEMVQERLEAV